MSEDEWNVERDGLTNREETFESYLSHMKFNSHTIQFVTAEEQSMYIHGKKW